MKTRLLIILVAITIGVIVASTVGTMEYQSTYNQNCNSDGGKIVGFLKCIYINEDVAEPIPVLDEGYEICLIENGTAKMVSESELQEHLAHGATTGDCRILFPRPESISSDDVKSSGTFYPRIHIFILPDSDTELHYVDPDFVTIGPGSQVTWSNYDDVPISLNSIDPDNPWSTAVISPDGYDTLTFDETGIYEYRGSPEIHGFIIVMDDDDSTRHHRDFYFSDWYDQNELNSAGCDKPILRHLSIYSNLLDGEFNGKYSIEEIGLPDGVSKEKFEECVEFILEKRMPKDDVKSTQEHYAIEITGLKDVYIVGERYDFSYILSGYGHSCGGKTVTFPDSNGDTIGNALSASCIANLPMEIFVFDIQKEQGTTYGHVEIKNPGTYTVTITFDRPSQYFPTTASQEFRVVEE